MPRHGGHLAVRNSLIVLACPHSAYSAKGGFGRAQAVPHGRVFFLGFHALSQARHTCFFTVPCGIIAYLDLAIRNCCIYRVRASGACRDFFSRSGERFKSIRPPSCPLAWLAPGGAACREHAGGGCCNVHQKCDERIFFPSLFFFP